MRPVLRHLRNLTIMLLVAVGVFGLAMKSLDLPVGPLSALSALPQRIAAEMRYRFRQGKAAAQAQLDVQPVAPPLSQQQPHTLRPARAAIGCGSAVASESPPGEQAASGANITRLDGRLQVSVNAENTVIPGYFERQLNAAADQIYKQWEQWLGVRELPRTPISLRFMGDEEAFMAQWGRDSQDWKPLGFYRIRNNEAVIFYSAQQRQKALATAFHEMSHLITASFLGPSPAWLNEGMAEHFETMDLTRNQIRFWMDGRHIGLLRQEGLVPLQTLTGLSRRDWATQNAELRYASAWALVTFLFASEHGRETLTAVISDAYARRCEGSDDLRASLAQYPGGINTLESELGRWIRGA